MWKFCLIIICIACNTAVYGQENLSGDWRGTTLKDDGKGFSLLLHLEQKGDSLTGIMKEISLSDAEVFALKKISGRVQNDILQFTDISIIDENSTKRLLWCRKTSSGKFYRKEMRIEGSWLNEGEVFRKKKLKINEAGPCRPGNFVLYKIRQEEPPAKADTVISIPEPVSTEQSILIKAAQRKNSVKSRIEAFADSVTLEFYDNGEIDGDTITVIYNSKILLLKRGLTAKPLLLKLPVILGSENQLLMFANNLGSIPPNTALLIFYDGKKEHAIRLDADEGSNALVSIFRPQ